MHDWSYCCEPSSSRATSRSRTTPAVGRSWPCRTDLDDDVAELLRLDQPAQRADRQLELLARRDRLLADLPGGHLDVLLADGRDHVAGGQVREASFFGSSQTRML